MLFICLMVYVTTVKLIIMQGCISNALRLNCFRRALWIVGVKLCFTIRKIHCDMQVCTDLNLELHESIQAVSILVPRGINMLQEGITSFSTEGLF